MSKSLSSLPSQTETTSSPENLFQGDLTDSMIDATESQGIPLDVRKRISDALAEELALLDL